MVVESPEFVKVEEKPVPPPIKVIVDQEAPQSVGDKLVQVEAPAAPVQEHAPEKRHEQV